MPRTARTLLAATATVALALGGALIGSAPAFAGDPADACNFDSDLQFSTAGAHWLQVCDHDGEIGEAATPHKNDGFDGVGYIRLNDGTSLPINVPEGDGHVSDDGAEITITFTDVDVDSGGGDLVDIVVVRTFEGSFVSWSVSVFDSNDGLPRGDVPLALTGNLGSDGATIIVPLGQSMVSYGDYGDPVIAWQLTAANGAFSPIGQDIRVEFESAVTELTVGLIDYGCTEADMEAAAMYAQSIAPTLSSLFGQSLVAPGSTFCSEAPAEMYFAPGQPFDVVVPVSYSGAMSFANGGEIYYWEAPEWIDVENSGVVADGVTPTLRLTGVAPASGSWLFSFDTLAYDAEGGEAAIAGNWITVIAGVPPAQLAATGSTGLGTSFWLVGAGALMLGLIALVGVRARRVRAA